MSRERSRNNGMHQRFIGSSDPYNQQNDFREKYLPSSIYNRPPLQRSVREGSVIPSPRGRSRSADLRFSWSSSSRDSWTVRPVSQSRKRNTTAPRRSYPLNSSRSRRESPPSWIPPPPYQLQSLRFPSSRRKPGYDSRSRRLQDRHDHRSALSSKDPYNPGYYDRFNAREHARLPNSDERSWDDLQVDFSPLSQVRSITEKTASSLMPAVKAVMRVCRNVSRTLDLRSDDLQHRASVNEIESTSTELAGFAVVLNNLYELLKECSGIITTRAFDDVNTTLQLCKKCLERIKSVITTSRTVPSRLNFLRKDSLNSCLSKVKPVRSNLECYKTSLTAMVSTIILADLQRKRSLKEDEGKASLPTDPALGGGPSDETAMTVYELDAAVAKRAWRLEDEIYDNANALQFWQSEERIESNQRRKYSRYVMNRASPASLWIADLIPFQPQQSGQKRIGGPARRMAIASGSESAMPSTSQVDVDEDEEQARVEAVIRSLLQKWTKAPGSLSESISIKDKVLDANVVKMDNENGERVAKNSDMADEGREWPNDVHGAARGESSTQQSRLKQVERDANRERALRAEAEHVAAQNADAAYQERARRQEVEELGRSFEHAFHEQLEVRRNASREADAAVARADALARQLDMVKGEKRYLEQEVELLTKEYRSIDEAERGAQGRATQGPSKNSPQVAIHGDISGSRDKPGAEISLDETATRAMPYSSKEVSFEILKKVEIVTEDGATVPIDAEIGTAEKPEDLDNSIGLTPANLKQDETPIFQNLKSATSRTDLSEQDSVEVHVESDNEDGSMHGATGSRANRIQRVNTDPTARKDGNSDSVHGRFWPGEIRYGDTLLERDRENAMPKGDALPKANWEEESWIDDIPPSPRRERIRYYEDRYFEKGAQSDVPKLLYPRDLSGSEDWDSQHEFGLHDADERAEAYVSYYMQRDRLENLRDMKLEERERNNAEREEAFRRFENRHDMPESSIIKGRDPSSHTEQKETKVGREPKAWKQKKAASKSTDKRTEPGRTPSRKRELWPDIVLQSPLATSSSGSSISSPSTKRREQPNGTNQALVLREKSLKDVTTEQAQKIEELEAKVNRLLVVQEERRVQEHQEYNVYRRPPPDIYQHSRSSIEDPELFEAPEPPAREKTRMQKPRTKKETTEDDESERGRISEYSYQGSGIEAELRVWKTAVEASMWFGVLVLALFMAGSLATYIRSENGAAVLKVLSIMQVAQHSG